MSGNGDAAIEETRAPGPLGVVQAFINTLDVEARIDELASPGAAAGWLAGADLPGGDEAGGRQVTADALTDGDVRLLAELREALRSLALANHGEGLEAGAVAALERVGAAAPVRFAAGPDGRLSLRPAAQPAGDGDVSVAGAAAAAAVLAVVHEAMLDGTWARLKVCRDSTCLWAYYDHSRNRSRAWCSMAVCGNRAKARTYRRRHG